MRKPRKFKLTNLNNFDLEAGDPGQNIFYLKTGADTYYWIQGRRKLKALIKWLKQVEMYQTLRMK